MGDGAGGERRRREKEESRVKETRKIEKEERGGREDQHTPTCIASSRSVAAALAPVLLPP